MLKKKYSEEKKPSKKSTTPGGNNKGTSEKLGHKKTGRKTYDEVIIPRLPEIQAWRESGLSVEKIAEKLGISIRQMYYHIEKPELAEIFQRKVTILVEELKNTLFDKALGRCKSKKTVIDQRTEMKDGVMTVTYEKKHVEITEHAPDLGALIFALCNLDSKNWKRSDREDVLNDIKIVLHDTIINAKKDANRIIGEAKKEIYSNGVQQFPAQQELNPAPPKEKMPNVND